LKELEGVVSFILFGLFIDPAIFGRTKVAIPLSAGVLVTGWVF
jgi:hypothetical protein